MLEILHLIERELPNLLKSSENWKSLYIDYQKPYVERLWTQLDDYRIYLHKIYPCNEEEAFYHDHPWPSAMKMLLGEYEMKIGIENFVVSKQILTTHSEYEMLHKDAFHSVRPLRIPSYSLMISGKKFSEASKSAKFAIGKQFEELSEEKITDLLFHFRYFYDCL